MFAEANEAILHKDRTVRKAVAPAEAWFVYILRCADGSLYTGIAKDVTRRCEQHNAGTASRYTRSRLPVRVRIVAMTPLGYPSKADLNNPVDENRRKPEADIFSTDYYSGRAS